MRYGALIVAAGMSTRMQQFKQLMRVGDMSFAERVVNTFQRAGVTDIVMVTGYEAARLEEDLKELPIQFVRNENYETTQMFDSAKLGLTALAGRVDRVFFCPVDVPFFLEETLRLEMERDEDLVYPICHNRLGHPVLFSAELIPKLLSYDGPRGLKGAFDSLYSQTTCFLPVADEGAVMDADTKQDLEYLIDMQNSKLIHAEVKVILSANQAFFEPELRELLDQIEKTKSVRAGCEASGISYSKGWQLIQAAEHQLGYQIVLRQAGGKNGGASRISRRGKHLMTLYDALQSHVRMTAEQEFCNLFSASELFPNSSREKEKGKKTSKMKSGKT